MATAIQFYGSDAVLTAVQNRDCPNWAIFQGRQFLFKYEGGDMDESTQLLGEILENLRHSTAVYTIQFYEDAPKIKANTPHDGSFNFRLISEEARQERQQMYATGSTAVLQKLESIEARLGSLEDDDDDAEEEEPGGIMGILQDPQRLGAITHGLQVLSALLGINKPQPAGSLAGINPPVSVMDPKITAALEALAAKDPKLPEHLEKLAQLAQNDPATFTWLLGMLEKM